MQNRIGMFALLVVLMFTLFPGSAFAAPYESYQYDFYGYAVAAPAPYLPERALTGLDLGIGHFEQPNDMHITENGHLYVLDSGNNRIVHINERGDMVRIISSFANDDGFNQPTGLYVTRDGTIYVADTENRRVVVLSAEGELKKTVENPESDILPPDFQFYPLKLTVDQAGRIYVISRGMFEGIMQFDENGQFLGFVGTNKVRPNIADYIWRYLSTREQRERMVLFIPSEFSNVDVDERGFIYATNVDLTTDETIKRINPSGEDVLKRYGYHHVKGDIQYDLYGSNRGPSRLIDIVYRGDGMYSVLDGFRGRVFTYDHEGNLLYVFGGIGNQHGVFRTPVALAAMEEKLAVLDRGTSRIMFFEPTSFGRAVNTAVSLQYQGKDEEAVPYWREALRLNANFDIAYIGIGKAYLMERKNREAMEYFKLGMNRKYYSTAFKRYRKEVMREHFGAILNTVILLSAGFVFYRIYGKVRKRRGNTGETTTV